MGYRHLQEFIARLEQAGELVRIKEPVSPRLEITEITDRVCKMGGPALLFEEVAGYQMPVLMNAFGSLKRMCLALEVDSLEAIAAEILSCNFFIKVSASASRKLKISAAMASRESTSRARHMRFRDPKAFINTGI